MLAKLSVRNMRRSARDYLVYILTMTLVTALMYAFNSLIFQNELEGYFDLVPLMAVMIGMATFFIVLIVAWLINYIVRFMLEKRSAEFGIYLLLGMKKKTVSRLYMRENLLLGGVSFAMGIVLGILFQQVLMTVMFTMIRQEYRLHVSFHPYTVLTTVLCFAGCYLLALMRCRRRFKRMNIHGLMNAGRQNEEIREKHERAKRILFPLSIVFILFFWAVFGRIDSAAMLFLFLVGLVLTIYLFYLGLSAWIICYVRDGGKAVYRGQNLFLFRQFASKVRSMQFTMGTLTALFTLALMGASVGLMFSEYENTVLEVKFPFDVQIYSGDAGDDFARERAVIDEAADVQSYYRYNIYTDDRIGVNTWMLTHLSAWGAMFRNSDGAPDEAEIRRFLRDEGVYYPADTYMGITDYNRLRAMLGYPAAELPEGSYLVHIKPRLAVEAEHIGEELQIADASGTGLLSCAGVNAEPFEQDGHNGADYLIVVPDSVLARMRPYYAELVAELAAEAPAGLQERLEALLPGEDPVGYVYSDSDLCCGSDNIITYAAVQLVRDNLIPEVKYMLASLIIPLFYIGLVFVCVAVTVLSVQQLSDSAKYRYRYEVLEKLGLNRSARDGLILKQLLAYYMCPAVLAIIISGKMILFASRAFVNMTGVPGAVGIYFVRSILLFFGIYLVYFIVTFIGFKRNVEEKGKRS